MVGDRPVNTESMRVADLLGLPDRARQSYRLTKRDIVAQWEGSSSADARLLGRVISSARITAVLSPATVGAAAVETPDRRVDMIPVIEINVVDGAKKRDTVRVAELLHRSMPRPSILGLYDENSGTASVSVALTRLSQTDAGRSVVEEHLVAPTARFTTGSLHVARITRTDLATLHDDLVRAVAADGKFPRLSLSATEAVGLRRQITAAADELTAVARDASREPSMQRRIDLNTRARTLRTSIDALEALLAAPPAPTIPPTDPTEDDK